jgi:DNA-binding IclR family transcriptional regulator
VQSVEIGLKVAMALGSSPSGGLGLSELAKIAGMPASKVHRYVVSLCRAGMAEQNPRTGRYDLSWAAIRLGLAAEARMPHLKALGGLLAELNHACGAPAAAAIWTSHGPTIVKRAESEFRLIIDTRVGARLSVANTSLGRLFAAYLPANVVNPVLDQEIASGSGPRIRNRKLTRAQFKAHLDTIREQGFAFQEGDLVAGLQGLAAPVFDAEGHMVMSLSLVSLVGQADIGPESPAADRLLSAAKELTAQLRTPS